MQGQSDMKAWYLPVPVKFTVTIKSMCTVVLILKHNSNKTNLPIPPAAAVRARQPPAYFEICPSKLVCMFLACALIIPAILSSKVIDEVLLIVLDHCCSVWKTTISIHLCASRLWALHSEAHLHSCIVFIADSRLLQPTRDPNLSASLVST